MGLASLTARKGGKEGGIPSPQISPWGSQACLWRLGVRKKSYQNLQKGVNALIKGMGEGGHLALIAYLTEGIHARLWQLDFARFSSRDPSKGSQYAYEKGRGREGHPHSSHSSAWGPHACLRRPGVSKNSSYEGSRCPPHLARRRQGGVCLNLVARGQYALTREGEGGLPPSSHNSLGGPWACLRRLPPHQKSHPIFA